MFLAITKKRRREIYRENKEIIFTLICRLDSRKPSANKGNVSELQLSVF